MTYKLTFTSRDILLQNFFAAEHEQMPISYLVELAISYYAITGKYLPVGTVTTDEPKEYISIKAIYLKKDSIASQYLAEQKMLGEAYNATIKLILEQCLIIGDENKLMTKAEYLAHRQKINAYMQDKGKKPSLGLYSYTHKEESRAEAKAKQEIPAEKKFVEQKEIEKVSESTGQKLKKPKKTGKADLSFADNFVFGDIK